MNISLYTTGILVIVVGVHSEFEGLKISEKIKKKEMYVLRPLILKNDSFGDFKCILTNNKTVINRITLNVGLYL
jgi:calcineurin-like phosphoesterase